LPVGVFGLAPTLPKVGGPFEVVLIHGPRSLRKPEL
jgi:hypothetical protein